MMVSTSSGKASFKDWPDWNQLASMSRSGIEAHPHQTLSDSFDDLLRTITASADFLQHSEQRLVHLNEGHVGDKASGYQQGEEVELSVSVPPMRLNAAAGYG